MSTPDTRTAPGTAACAPGTAQLKKELRAQLKAQRAGLSADERAQADALIAARLFAQPAWESACVVLTYLSFGSEVDTRAIIRRAWLEGKLVALPRCTPGSRVMSWHCTKSLENLVHSPLGTEEPVCDPATLISPADCSPAETLAIVPGLAFDARGFRLGYGGGYYDVFLAGFSGTSAGLCRKGHLLADLSELGLTEAHDRPVSLVISDNEP